jgi:hypothetical protein
LNIISLLFGDPYQFKESKGKLDITKRIKSFLSPRRTTFDHPIFNSFLNIEMNKVNGITIEKREDGELNVGYHNHKSYTDAVIIKDNEILGSLTNVIRAYGGTDESDAMSWLMDNTYREVKMKNKQWDDKAEAFHQWQMAYTRNKLAAKKIYTYTNEELRAHDEKLISKPAPKHKIEVLKPIVTGNVYNKGEFHTILHKMSQMPIYYSMVEGRSMEKFYIQMATEGKGYAVVNSGAKVGVEQEHPLYNSDGSFNEQPFNNSMQVPWSAYGIQVETVSGEGEQFQTRGSQLTKMASMDIFNNGQVIGDTPERQKEIQAIYNENKELLDLMHQNAYVELLNDLAIEDLGDNFVMKDGRSVMETLSREMRRRVVSDNTKESLDLDEETNQFKMPFEASPAYDQIRKIVYSMIDKAIISTKMHGGAHVQAAVSMFEDIGKGRRIALKEYDADNKFIGWKHISKAEYEALDDTQKKNVAITDDTLKFYTKDKPYCEVLVPHWFKDKFPRKIGETDKAHETRILDYLNSDEGKKILTGIGFRIPTQSLSSVEVFRVKGFLPQYMGHTVIVPSEITVKAGSDFDIDKLNMYLKSVYVDGDGKMKLIEYKGSEEATKSFYAKMWEYTKAKEIEKLMEFERFRDRLFELFGQIQTEEEQNFDVLREAVGYDDKEVRFVDDHQGTISDIMEEAAEKGISAYDYLLGQYKDIETAKRELTKEAFVGKRRDDFIKTMYKRALENQYYESLEKLVTLPEVFDRLIKPVDDAGLSNVANELDRLTGYDESTIRNRTLDRNYMTPLRNSFVVAKKWVGIAASNITALAIKQKAMVYMDPERFNGLTPDERGFIDNGSAEFIQLSHNFVSNEAGVRFVSLSGTHTADGTELISDRYSGYATAFVDVAKDPFIMKIIKSDLVVGMFMFLENIGVGKTSAFFMAQPIIVEYLKIMEKNGSRNVFSSKNIADVRAMFGISKELIQQNEGRFSVDSLKHNISDYYEDGGKERMLGLEDFKIEQSNIFDEFLKYAVMSDQSFQFTQALTYDTTRVTNGDFFARKQWDTDRVRSGNIFTSVDEVLNNSHIGEQKRIIEKMMASMSSLFKLEDRGLRAITYKVLRPYAANKFISEDDFNRISNKIKSSFMDFIITIASKRNLRIEELVVNDTTAITVKLAALKLKYPDHELLHSFEEDNSVREGGGKTIKLSTNIKEAYDENRFTGMMRELRDTNQELRDFFYDLLDMSLIQGTSPSAVSIRNIIPIENFAHIVGPIMKQLQATPELDMFSKGFFQKNNFNDNKIVPVVAPEFEIVDEWYDSEIDEMMSTQIAKSFPNYSIKGVKATDRKILFLSEKLHANAIDYEVVKIPRVVGGAGGYRIDLQTGNSVTDKDFYYRKNIGDYTLHDFYGYQKVRYDSGEPVTVYYGPALGTQYVYKLVNFLGDGYRIQEHRTNLQPSVVNNASVKVAEEMTNTQVIEIIGADRIKEKVPVDVILEIEDPKGRSKAMLEHVGAKPVSRSKLKVDGEFYYLDFDFWKAEINPEGGYDLMIYPTGRSDINGQPVFVATSYPGSVEFFSDITEGKTKAAERKPSAGVAPRTNNLVISAPEERVRREYPDVVQGLSGPLETRKILEIANLPHIETNLIDNKYIKNYRLLKQVYGYAAEYYADEVSSEISVEEANYMRSYPRFMKSFIEDFIDDERGEGVSMQEYAQKLLDENIKYTDTHQLSMFGPQFSPEFGITPAEWSTYSDEKKQEIIDQSNC